MKFCLRMYNTLLILIQFKLNYKFLQNNINKKKPFCTIYYNKTINLNINI